MGSIPTASTIAGIRTAFRVLDQLQDLQGGFGLIVRAADLRRDRGEANRPEDSPEQQRRRRRLTLEHLLDFSQSLCNPLHRWRCEDISGSAFQRPEMFSGRQCARWFTFAPRRKR